MQSNLFGVVCHLLDTDILMCHNCPQLGTEFSRFVRYLVLISSLPLHSSPVRAQQAAAWAWLAAWFKAVQSKRSSCFLIPPTETRAVCFKLQFLGRSHDSSCRNWAETPCRSAALRLSFGMGKSLFCKGIGSINGKWRSDWGHQYGLPFRSPWCDTFVSGGMTFPRHAEIHSEVPSVLCSPRLHEFGGKRGRSLLPQHTYDHNCRPKIRCLLSTFLLAFGLDRMKLGKECQQVGQRSPDWCCFSSQTSVSSSKIISVEWKKLDCDLALLCSWGE